MKRSLLREMEERSRVWQKLVHEWYRGWGQDVRCTCGHAAKRKTYISLGTGESGGLYYLVPEERPDWCPDCFVRAARPCGDCGKLIPPSGEVAIAASEDGSAVYHLSCTSFLPAFCGTLEMPTLPLQGPLRGRIEGFMERRRARAQARESRKAA